MTQKAITKIVQNDPLTRLNAACPYYTMFPLEFPHKHLIKAKDGEWVLDPFCGRGTTNFAARLLNLPSVGIDSNPVAAAIAAAKFVYVRPEEIINLCNAILYKKTKPKNVPTGQFWKLCYHPRTLMQVCKIREDLLRDCSTPARVALRAIMLGVLHGPQQKTVASYLSNQMPRTYATKPKAAVSFWLKHGLVPKYISVSDVVERRAHYLFYDIPPSTRGFILHGDSRNITLRKLRMKFRWVITSPPYLGMSTYVPDQWIRNWFVGGPSTVQYVGNGQLGYQSRERFIGELAQVWQKVSKMCLPGARLIIRFGALPSLKHDHVELLKESLKKSQASWRIVKVSKAGKASQGYRQAYQFSKKTKKAIEEIDLYAVLRK